MLSTAQTLTEAQKQEALQSAIKFCNLLKRFCEGERTLDTQIYGLCSGADCSAYDEIRTNSEKTLRNYLLAIQTKYPGELSIQLSAPSFSKSEIYYDYDYLYAIEYGDLDNHDNDMGALLSLTKNKVLNCSVIFNVTITIPSLSKHIQKKLIYSTKTGKITAFVMQNSPVISCSKGIDCFAKGDYNRAIGYFDEAVRNGGERFSHKRECYIFAYNACLYSLDLQNAYKYATLLGDFGYILSAKGQMAIKENRISDAIDCYSQIEKGILEGKQSLLPIENTYYLLGHLYSYPGTTYNSYKCAEYLKKCANSKDYASDMSAYWIYVYWLLNQNEQEGGISDEDMNFNDAYLYLKKAANNNYPPAYILLGIAELKDMKNLVEAATWLERSAFANNAKAMAILGKLLTSEEQFAHRKKDGIEWLRESLQGNILEKSINDYEETVSRNIWPNSRQEVEAYLRQITNDNTANSNSSVHNNVSSNTSSTNVSTSGNTTARNNTSSYSYRRHREFNKNPNESGVAFSVGYVQKQWVYDVDGAKEKVDVFGEDKYTNGIQAGFRIAPQFKYGFGLDLGLYYEYYFDKSEDMYDDGWEYNLKSEEHCLYLPIHLKYNLNFSKWFQLGVYGGIGLDYGLSGKIYARSDGETLDSFGLYDDGLDMKRFNTSLEYGASLRINNFEINFSISNGLINMSDSEDYKVKQNKPLNISASWYL